MIERRDGSGSFPLYEVWIDGQGPFVARKDVFNIAQMMENTIVDAITRDEEKNGYLNHYLDFVSSAGQTQMQPQPNPAAQEQQAQPQTAQEVLSQPSEAELRKEMSIHRQTASKVAALVSPGDPIGFWMNCQALMRWYQSGVVPELGGVPRGNSPMPDPPRQNSAAYQQYRDEPGNQYQGDPGSPLPPPEDSDIPF
jgi:hypothetical protein